MHNLSNLTLLLTTKGREEFTIRWMYYMNAFNLPVKVIIAEGGDSNTLEEVLSDRSNYPNVDYQFLKFSDVDLNAFYTKCYEATKLVNTKYVKIIDNDDFILPFGISRDIKFLDDNPDYVASQGLVSGIEISPKDGGVALCGRVKKLLSLYSKHYEPRSFDSESRTDCVYDMLKNYHPVYYAVYRREALLEIFSQVCRLSPQDLIIHETFMAAYAVGLGKVRSANSHISLLRQIGTSSNSKTDIVKRIFKPNFFRDLDQASESLCTLLQSRTAHDNDFVKNKIRSCYEDYFRLLAEDCYKSFPIIWSRLGRLKGNLFFSVRSLDPLYFWKRSSKAIGVTSECLSVQQNEIRKLIDLISTDPGFRYSVYNGSRGIKE